MGAYTGLLAIWSYRHQSSRAPVLLGVLEAVLVLAATVAGPDPMSILPYTFASPRPRALYGTTRGALLHTGFLAVAVVVALWVWTMLPGRPDMAPAASIAGHPQHGAGHVPDRRGVARYLARSLLTASLIGPSNNTFPCSSRTPRAQIRETRSRSWLTTTRVLPCSASS